MILFNDFKKEYKELEFVVDSTIKGVLESGWYILGEQVKQFEEKFARKNGSKYCVGVGNGLDALKIALMSLGIGPGDEVITTSHSAVATTLAILDLGAIPVFVDIDDRYQIDYKKIEKSITSKTKAILPVHLYGRPCDILEIKKISDKYGLFLIEDCAQAHFAKVGNKKVGTFGDLGCYSFYPTKNLGAFGDGGAIVTNDKDLYERCIMIRNYGQKNRYEHEIYGINSRLDEIQAAVLNIKLDLIDSYLVRRNEIAKKYIDNLKHIEEIKIVEDRKNIYNVYHLFVIECKNRDKLSKYLINNGVQNLVHYPIPIHKQKCITAIGINVELPILEEKVKYILSLPIHPFLTDEEVDEISKLIIDFYGK